MILNQLSSNPNKMFTNSQTIATTVATSIITIKNATSNTDINQLEKESNSLINEISNFLNQTTDK